MYTTGKRKIGLYGGSFNPIHVGHITLAKRLMEVAGLDEVWMMVSPQNPFKANDTLLADDLRLAMTRKALEGETHIVACDYEFHLPKPPTLGPRCRLWGAIVPIASLHYS